MPAPSQLDVVIGVNGIGMGHSVRESEIARHLLSRGHRVRVITTSAPRARYFREQGISVLEAWMPTLIEHEHRIRTRDAVRNNARYVLSGLRRHRVVRRLIEEGGIPDVFLTDYEPNAPRLAYHFRRPLISVDQQSKYRHLDLPPIHPYSCAPDRRRLQLFAPRADRSFICSFVPLTSRDPTLEFLPPVIPDALRTAPVTTEPMCVGYFSRYFSHGPEPSVARLSAIFRDSAPHLRLRLYAQPADMPHLARHEGGNVEIRAFDRDAFLTDLARAQAVFSNAGFNLIAEAIALGKPLCVVPLPTYDQHWCARSVTAYGLGVDVPRLEEKPVRDFLHRVPELASSVREHRQRHLADDPRERIAAYLEGTRSDSSSPTR
ncbi:UDP-glucuronosyltransferase-like protein [Streptomyces armeniacus]|uniref:UDP-glucuronosyltransferase-like protein n=1 Tax=Streptomyces armeniacus TaxID=83291 RepID=A0A345XVE2_9ACTN|nr:glycosyltransferase family protein [Streptomyces armeniacus]AXK35608.1 UDP-glucuronosyltransferase-like protein [Streptomyces armeniacus]